MSFGWVVALATIGIGFLLGGGIGVLLAVIIVLIVASQIQA